LKKFILIFVGLAIFDVLYSDLHYEILKVIDNEYLKYPFIILNYLISSPAIFFDDLLPFYKPLPTYQSILIFLGNVLIQTFLVFQIFFRSNKKAVQS